MIRVLALCVLAAGPVVAQEGFVAPEMFQEGQVGQTLSYRFLDGTLWGREHWPSANRTVWQDPDGDCLNCDVLRVGDRLCFSCDNSATSCWQHFEEPGGRVRVLSDNGMEAIAKADGRAPLSCGPVPLS